MDDNDATRVLASAEVAGVPFRWMERPSNDVNTPCVYEITGGWRVSTTDERATEESVRDYVDRPAAVHDFLSRVRGLVRYKELRTRSLGV